MVYLFLNSSSVSLLALSKSLLGQYTISHFSKQHTVELVKNGAFSNVDIVASAVKEALTSAQPNSITENQVYLILPQSFFTFGRYVVPPDMSDSAVEPFIKDKARQDLGVNVNSAYFDYLIKQDETENTVLFYGLTQEAVASVQELSSLLQLEVVQILPDTLAYYTLFEKTLRKEKRERILYALYNNENSYAYLFDSFGLMEKDRIELGKDAKQGLTEKVDQLSKQNIKVNRLILSGTQSRNVRQDLFTKEVGAWTNPLEKIIDNFYSEFLKLIVPENENMFSVLELDACFGAFVFDRVHSSFSILSGLEQKKPTTHHYAHTSEPKKKISLGFMRHIFNVKTLVIFAISFALSFGVMFLATKIKNGEMKVGSMFARKEDKSIEELLKESEAKKVAPTKAPAPTPKVNREEIKVKILNGSGIAGKATEVKDELIKAGYSDIVTGNADNFDYTTSEIQIKDDKKNLFELFTSDIKDMVKVTESSTLNEDEAADIIFIIGQDIDGEEADAEAAKDEKPTPTVKKNQ